MWKPKRAIDGPFRFPQKWHNKVNLTGPIKAESGKPLAIFAIPYPFPALNGPFTPCLLGYLYLTYTIWVLWALRGICALLCYLNMVHYGCDIFF